MKFGPRKDIAVFDLTSDTIAYAQFYDRSHDAVIRVYDEAGNVRRTSTRDSSESGEFTFITPKPMFSHGQFR
jgi:hypothetical protein